MLDRIPSLSVKVVAALVAVLALVVSADDTSTNDLVNLSSDQIARLRQFKAENHYVTSQDGYIINLVRIPAIKQTNKRPVLFNHGTTQSSTYFMTNSVGARPRDFSQLDAGSMTEEELEQVLANEPSAKSMPLLMSNCGHDVWLVNRRGTEFSLGRSGSMGGVLSRFTSRLSDLAQNLNPYNYLPSSYSSSPSSTSTSSNSNDDDNNTYVGAEARQEQEEEQPENSSSGLFGFLKLFFRPQLNLGSIPNTFDRGYWNFSLDEQALYDLPAILTYVLDKTGSEKVAYVGHSLGNGVMFMLQSEHPEWAEKVEPFLAYSPDLYLRDTTSIIRPLFIALQPINTISLMPFPPTPILPFTRTLMASMCQTRLAQETICRLLQSAMWGFSGAQQQNLPAFVASQFYAVSSHETAQLAQNVEKDGKMYHFDFGKAGNQRAYGQAEPPIYNISRIISKSISLWHGDKDILATITDVNRMIQDLRVPIDDRFIQKSVNHYDLLFGRNVTTYVNLPSLKVIESYK